MSFYMRVYEGIIRVYVRRIKEGLYRIVDEGFGVYGAGLVWDEMRTIASTPSCAAGLTEQFLIRRLSERF